MRFREQADEAPDTILLQYQAQAVRYITEVILHKLERLIRSQLKKKKGNQFSIFFRKGNILISQLLHQPMHIVVSYYRITEFQDLIVSSKVEVPHTSSDCQLERFSAPETAAAVRDSLHHNTKISVGRSDAKSGYNDG
jgi:hypothetical protein